MGSSSLPVVGAQARRKADGMLGEVYATDPPHNLLSVRWPTIPGSWDREDCTPDQFARAWELTGAKVAEARDTHVAMILISLFVLALFGYVIVRNAGSIYAGYDPSRPVASLSPSIANDAEALYQKYGMLAAVACATGADNYIRSVSPHRFHWNDTGMLEPRFDEYSHTVASPGVIVMISHKAAISDGFGNFKPITISCNFDTQSREVLFYTSEGTAQTSAFEGQGTRD